MYANAEVRETTRSPSTLASALITSSVIPSEKYSSSLAGLKFAKGRTATDGAAGTAGAAGLRPVRVKCQATAGTTAIVATAPNASATRRPPGPPGRTGTVRSILPAVTSKTQASTTTTGNPAARATTTNESVQSGRWSPCIPGSITWRMANETMA